MFKNWSNNGFFKSATLDVSNWNTDSSLTSSLFFISCQIHIRYKPSPSSTMKIEQHVESPYNLSSPCTHFLSCEHQCPKSLLKLSSFISHMNIPFSKNQLEYSNISCNNSEPIPVRNHADLVRYAFHDIRSLASDVVMAESEIGSKLAVHICLTLHRTVVLTQDDFDTLDQVFDGKDREDGGLTSLVSDLMEYRMTDDFSLPALQEFFFSEKGIALTKDLIDQLNETVLKERLLKVLTLEEDSEELCSICHEELRDDGEAIVATPCSHLFHRECIMKWMKTHNACPMCRFRFFVSSCSEIEP